MADTPTISESASGFVSAATCYDADALALAEALGMRPLVMQCQARLDEMRVSA